MVSQGVIRQVDDHTELSSSLVYSTKKDGSIRICIDHSDSTQRYADVLTTYPHWMKSTRNSLKRNCLATGCESRILVGASQRRRFTAATTFLTPFGRFCWRKQPSGLNVSQDIFQARMDQILEDLKGVTGIGDDVCVYSENDEDHDWNLTNLMERAHE